MRTYEERLDRMHQRALDIKNERINRRIQIISAVTAVCCLALVIGMATLIPEIASAGMPAGQPGNMSGSIFSGHTSLSFIVTAILSFMLGISVTVFCITLNRQRQEKNKLL